MSGWGLSRMRNSVFFLGFLLLCCGFARADDLNQVSRRLAQPQIFSVGFVQKKHIRILARPLVSSGTLWVDQNVGVVWQTETPLSSRVVIAHQNVSFSDMQTRRTIKSMEFLADILKGVVSGNIDAIQEQFDVSVLDVGGDNKSWIIELSPKSALIKKGIESIKMSGHEYVDEIILKEVSGDQTEINFHGLSALDGFPVELVGVFEEI